MHYRTGFIRSSFGRVGKSIVEAKAQNSQNSEKRVILLVEDREEVRSMLTDFLECMNYQVHACAAAEEALILAKNQSIQLGLIITDVLLETSTGPKLIAEIRDFQPEIPVIFISGFSEQALADELDFNANTQFLQKPFPLDVLCAKIQEMMPIAA